MAALDQKLTFKDRINDFGKFIYNKEEGKVLGRGGRSWAEIGLFYFIYYSCLAGFFAVTIVIFYETIDDDSPKLQSDSSLLKGNPGMGFKPMPDIETTLIRFSNRTEKGMSSHVKNIEKALAEYNQTLSNTVDCSGIATIRKDAKTACEVNFTALTEKCNPQNKFGLQENKPCVLLKLNRIFDWTPRIWDSKDDIPKGKMSDQLKNKYKPDKIWVECHGENVADKDNIGFDDIEYFPTQGFPLAYYPFLKQKNYLSPLIFVKFNKMTLNMGMMIECKALARNIRTDRTEKQGSVHFEMLIDP